LFAAIGIHPQLAGRYAPRDVQALEDLAGPKVVAVGETGFDLYRTPATEDLQTALFQAHIELARRLKLPLVIHDRQAHTQTLSLLDETDGWSLGGVMHCFSGDVSLARIVLDKGFYISIPGVITYKNAQDLVAAASYAPTERLLIETDAPYLSPHPYRGKPNEPAYLVETLTCLARLKEIDIDEMAAITVHNFQALFLNDRVESRRRG
jgi:TatD DNase family protein